MPCSLAARSASSGLQLGPPFSSSVPHTSRASSFRSAALAATAAARRNVAKRTRAALRIIIGSNESLFQVDHGSGFILVADAFLGWLDRRRGAVVLQPNHGHLGGLVVKGHRFHPFAG